MSHLPISKTLAKWPLQHVSIDMVNKLGQAQVKLDDIVVIVVEVVVKILFMIVQKKTEQSTLSVLVYSWQSDEVRKN